MKELAWGALEMVQTASSLAAEATADVAVPGLSIALSALSEILNKILVSGHSQLRRTYRTVPCS